MNVGIVHSNPLIQSTLKEFLTQLRHGVFHVDNLNDLSTCISHFHDIDVMIVEVLNLSETEVNKLRHLRELLPHVHLIVAKKHNSAFTVDKAFTLGIWAYLREPLCLEELELMLRNITANRLYPNKREVETKRRRAEKKFLRNNSFEDE